MKNSAFFSLILFCLTFIGFGIDAQQKVDSIKYRKFWSLNDEQEKNISKAYVNGKKMLLLAQNDYEKSLANSAMAENRYTVGDYVKAVEHLEVARRYAFKTDSTVQKIRVLNYLIFSYRRAGLPNKSDAYFEQLKSVLNVFPEEERQSRISYAQVKIYDIDEEYCKSAEIRRKYLSYSYENDRRSDYQKRTQYSLLCQSAYVQLKCGDVEATKKIFTQLDDLYNKINDKNTILVREFYLMTQGMLAARGNDKELSRKLFDSAINIANATNAKVIQKLILTERIEAEIDPPSEQLKFAKSIREITSGETRVTKDLTNAESVKVREILDGKERTQKLFIVLGTLVFVIFVGIAYYFYHRNKMLKKKYLEIISEIETEKHKLANNENLTNAAAFPVIKKSKSEKSPDFKPRKESLISDTTELEILNNLEIFEQKKLFTTSGITTAQMAVMVKTNTKYLSYILKKYRNSDFSQYINQKRIDYIVEELHDNLQARNYKIAVLAEMSGYNSHSQFANIFKNVKGISPSKFIEFLKEKHV